MVIHGILNTIAYGLIILALIFVAVDTVERKRHHREGSLMERMRFINQQLAVLLSIAGFILLIISMWIS